MIDLKTFSAITTNKNLKNLALKIPEYIENGLSEKRFGDLGGWIEALNRLPELSPSSTNLEKMVSIGSRNDIDPETYMQIKLNFESLIPWRKGPYSIFGLDIDTEWRSDWKWDRLLPHIKPLKNKTVLDVGCGNGYHCLRMFGEGANQVIGIDPSPRFIVQFYMVKKYLSDTPVDILPAALEDLPENLSCFDTTFSMGVLYHRRSPMDHLRQLRNTLVDGGELILETLVIDGKDGEVLVPEGRYAMMNNVWFLPSTKTLEGWLKKCGFKNVRTVDSCTTTKEEQRATNWMKFQSLSDFLDPNDTSKTVEGHPAPRRAILIAQR